MEPIKSNPADFAAFVVIIRDDFHSAEIEMNFYYTLNDVNCQKNNCRQTIESNLSVDWRFFLLIVAYQVFGYVYIKLSCKHKMCILSATIQLVHFATISKNPIIPASFIHEVYSQSRWSEITFELILVEIQSNLNRISIMCTANHTQIS